MTTSSPDGNEIDTLIEQCHTGDSSARIAALHTLISAGVQRAIPAIVPLAEADDAVVRKAAARALGELGQDHVDQVGPVLETLLSDPDAMVRSEAAEGVGMLRYAPSRMALEQMLLQDPDWVARASAAEALEYIGDTRALGTLEAALDDEAPPVRSYVATAIEELGGAGQLPVLRRRLAIETEPQPRTALIEIALRFGDEPAFDDLLSLVAEVAGEEFVYHVLRVVDELLDGPIPAVVLRRAAELDPHLLALSRRAGRFEGWAGEIRAKLAEQAGASADEK